ncbi:MAG: FHA domain-containing protein [Candidatus Omnitrophica bacterium]|nr:FHA domain-containing protein [Candidatus Omnitrophota bacterium]
MGKIILQIVSSSGSAHEPRVFNQSRVSIGRGFGNDLILQDSYVSAQHAVVSVSFLGKIEITDCQSENGTFLMPRQSDREPGHLLSGEMFSVGHTKIRVFLPNHPVTAARKIIAERPPLPVASLTLWYALVGFFVLYFFQLAASYPYEPMAVSQYIFYEFLAFLAVCLVSGIWALVGRMINQQARFGEQLTLMCFFMIVMIPIANICMFLGYASASMIVEGLLSVFLGGAALSILIFKQLSIATALGRRAKIIASLVLPAILMILGGLGAIAFRNEFSPKPRFYDRSKPPIIAPFKVYQPQQFISRTDRVFEELNTNASNQD